MMRFPLLVLSFFLSLTAASGQSKVLPFPKAVFEAKTVAILNNTHNEAVEQGAIDALKRWGRLTLVNDADLADITLTFDKKSEHEGASSQKPGEDGKPSSSYSFSFSSSVHMKAVLKGETSSFYAASTSESKKKAGAECVTDLQQAYLHRP